MAKLFNRVRVSTVTTGIGAVTLGAATANNFMTFAEAGVADGDVVSYVIEDGTDFEYGTGTYTSAGTTLSRTVRKSKIGGTAGTTKLTLSGSAIVYIDAAEEDIVQLDKAQTLTGKTIAYGSNTPTGFATAAQGALADSALPASRITISTLNPSGGVDNDIWIKVPS